MISLILALLACDSPGCAMMKVHPQATFHTHGKDCPGCGQAKIDVCYSLCGPCAKRLETCPGCPPVDRPIRPEPALRSASLTQARCVPDCPTSALHAQSLDHTEGKLCGCGRATDVCFALCPDCAEKKKVCRGCGAKPLAPGNVWSVETEREPGIRLEGDVVVISRGRVLASEKASLAGLREFRDRLELTLAVRDALCGSEPQVFDALCVQLPEKPAKKIVVREIRMSTWGPMRIETLATLPR